MEDTAVQSYCSGLSLINNHITLRSLNNALYFGNLRSLPIVEIDKIENNVLRFEWDVAQEAVSSSYPSTRRGIVLSRQLDFCNNEMQNFSGQNFLDISCRKFVGNLLKSDYDPTLIGITNLGFTNPLQASIYKDNLVDGAYLTIKEGIYDTLNSPNDMRRFARINLLQIKGANFIYDFRIGPVSRLPNPTYIRIRMNENTSYLLTKSSGTNISSYKIEQGTSDNGLSFTSVQTDSDGNGHILCASSSGGYFFPTLEVFGIYGALHTEIGQALAVTRRNKTAEDEQLTFTAPTQ